MSAAVTIPTEEEKARARYHLGYGGVTSAATFFLGTPAAVQTSFMIEDALNLITTPAYPKFIELLCRLDGLERQLFCGTDLADVEKVGEITINRKRYDELARYYNVARQALGNLLLVPPNPFDMRDFVQGGSANFSVG